MVSGGTSRPCGPSRRVTLPSPSRRDLLAAGACAGLAQVLSAFRPSAGAAEDRPGGRRSVDEDLAVMMGQAELSLLFRGRTRQECLAWQEAFRAKLEELLGDCSPPAKWRIEQQSQRQLADHSRIELVLHGDGALSVPVYLLTPNGVSQTRPAPAVVCVHGHGAYGNDPIVGRTDLEGVADAIAKNNYDYGLQFVRRGYVVAAPCLIPFGRRVNRESYGANDPCAVTFLRMQALGRLPISENLRALRWCVDLLESRPEVRSGRIGCAGLSYGGRMTMMVAAVDSRIGVAAVSGALNLMQERLSQPHSCGSQIIPKLLKYGDYSEIGALIAPRPCVWETGDQDPLIVPVWDEVFRDRLRRVYDALGAIEQLHFDRFQGRARVERTHRDAAVRSGAEGRLTRAPPRNGYACGIARGTAGGLPKRARCVGRRAAAGGVPDAAWAALLTTSGRSGSWASSTAASCRHWDATRSSFTSAASWSTASPSVRCIRCPRTGGAAARPRC